MGLPNLIEYAFGGSPTSNQESFTLRAGAMMEEGQARLLLAHPRHLERMVISSYRTTTDLSLPLNQWTTASTPPTITNPDLDGTGRVELVETPASYSGKGTLFMALLISEE